MNKRKLGSFALCAMLFALCFPAEAQQPAKSRIGFLTGVSSPTNSPGTRHSGRACASLVTWKGKNCH